MYKQAFKSVLALTVAVFGLTSAASATVWIDEDFDDPAIFQSGDGINVVGAFDIAPALTETGSRVVSPTFEGAGAYELNPGETVTIADGHDDDSSGDFINIQAAVSVDSIPAAGNVAKLTYTTNLDGTDYVFCVSLDSDGSEIDLISEAGDGTTTNTQTIQGAITAASTWEILTFQLMNGTAATADPRFPSAGTFAPGSYVYLSSATPVSTAITAGGGTKESNGWDFTVNPGTTANVYIDNLYWDGGMENDAGNSTLRDVSDGMGIQPDMSSVKQWETVE